GRGPPGDPGARMTVDLAMRHGIPVLQLVGELDARSTGEVKAALEGIRARSFPRVLLDMEHVTYVDSAGLRTVLEAVKAFATAGRRLELLAPGPAVQHILRITRVADQVTVHGSASDALGQPATAVEPTPPDVQP